jgi:hypothetical protein
MEHKGNVKTMTIQELIALINTENSDFMIEVLPGEEDSDGKESECDIG